MALETLVVGGVKNSAGMHLIVKVEMLTSAHWASGYGPQGKTGCYYADGRCSKRDPNVSNRAVNCLESVSDHNTDDNGGRGCYSRSQTLQMLKTLVATGPDKIEIIAVNDGVLRNQLNSWIKTAFPKVSISLVNWKGHNSHIHVRFHPEKEEEE